MSLGLCRRDRRHVVERIDLSVRVRDGGADLGAAVLEDADVCVCGIRPELASAVDPDREDAGELCRRQLAERGVVPVRVENDLTAPLRRSGRAVEERRRRRIGTERREPVVEDRRVVRKGTSIPPGQKGHRSGSASFAGESSGRVFRAGAIPTHASVNTSRRLWISVPSPAVPGPSSSREPRSSP